MFTPLQRVAWAGEPTLLDSPGLWVPGSPAGAEACPENDAWQVLLGRVGKGEGRFSRWLPFGLEPKGFRELILNEYSRRKGKASQQCNEDLPLHLGDAS